MRADSVLATIFERALESRQPWLRRAWLSGLFVAGLAAWAFFFAFGSTTLDFHDWADITVPRLTFLQHAVQAAEWPLHMARSNALHGVTERFLAIPDVITTPQLALLMWLPINTFVIVDVWINYALGFAGLLLLRRHLDWSLFTFTLAFLLILFNGHVLAHYSVGHFTWAAYFLFPVIAYLLLRYLDGDDSWRSIALFAATMAYMVMAGGQHHVTWVLLLLLVLLPFCRGRRRWVISAAVASVGLSAVRLLPPVLELQSFRAAGFVTDVVGYPSVWHLLESLVSLRREVAVPMSALPANLRQFDQRFWEFNVYVGVAGAALVAYGVYQWLRAEQPRYRQLIVPIFTIAALSMGSIYRLPRLSGVPLLLGERATSRMFSVALVLLIVIAATFINRQAAEVWKSWRSRLLALAALAFVVIDVSASIRLQRVAISSGLFGSSPFNPATPAHYSDPAYLLALGAGFAISVATALTLAVLVFRERTRAGAAR
jgi:hypothetical protein